MNKNDPKSSKEPNHKNSEKQSKEDSITPSKTPPITSPLSSPHEPTRAYPTDPTRTYSSDPSQYAYPTKESALSDNLSKDESSQVYITEHHDAAQLSGEAPPTSSSKGHEYQKHEEPIKDKVRDTFRQIKDSKKVDEIYDYAKHNKEQTITYILLILGLFILFFNNILGGLMIGMVAGYHFDAEIIYYLRNLNQIFKGQNQLRYVTLTALLLGLFIAAPGIFVGTAIVAAFKQVMSGKQDSNHPHNGSNSMNR